VPSNVLHRYDVSGVEQTSSGIFLFEDKPPPCPVISWARSAVKLEIGGPIFSHSFLHKFKTQFLRGRSLQGKQIGIIGFGSIGRGVAILAIRDGGHVRFYDPDARLNIPLQLRDQVTRVNSLEELMTVTDYVVGCSGRNPFKGKWPMKHKPGLRLLSASGGDQEFGPIIRDLRTRPDFKVDPHTWDITSKHGPSGNLYIAYMGYPYNFVSRAPEAVPGPIVQLETGGLLAALIEARLYLEHLEKDNRVHRMSSGAQHFIYKRWLHAMEERRIDVGEVFGYEAKTLSAAQHERWLAELTEPRTSEAHERMIEEMMTRVICPRHASRVLKRKPQSDLSAP
jgi:hypothetical protein